MKIDVLKVLAVLILSCFFVSCSKNNETPPEEEIIDLVSTLWELEGIVNEETGELKILEPKKLSGGRHSYGINFFSDSVIFGVAAYYMFVAEYEIDYTRNFINIFLKPMPGSGDSDEKLFVEMLKNVFEFSVQEDNLLLYFEDQKYLLFNPTEPCIHTE